MFTFCLVVTFFIAPNVSSLKVGIIGGGASALFLSRNLRENGFKDITIFEKEKKVSSIVDSYEIPSGIGSIDLTTKFIPTRSYVLTDPNEGFDDIYSGLRLIFDEIKQQNLTDTTLQIETAAFWDLTVQSFGQPEFVKTYINEIPELVAEISRGVLILLDVLENTKSISDLYNKGFTMKGENFLEWGIRNNLSRFAVVIAESSELVSGELLSGNKIGLTHSASYVLRRNSILGINTIRYWLIQLGVQSTDYSDTNDPSGFLRRLLEYRENTFAYNFINGYENVIQSVAEIEANNGVNIKLNSEVKKIKINSQKKKHRVKLQVSENGLKHKITYEFDAVFITVRPKDAVKILRTTKQLNKAYQLYSNAVNEAGSFFVSVWNITSVNNWIDPRLVQSSLAFKPFINEFGTLNSGNLLSLGCVPYTGYHDFYNESIFVVNAYANDINGNKIEINDCIQNIIFYLNNYFGFDVSFDDLLDFHYESHYPYIISTEVENNGWFDKFEALQGKNSVFYLGEVFSGQSIAVILRYIKQNIQQITEKLNKIQN